MTVITTNIAKLLQARGISRAQFARIVTGDTDKKTNLTYLADRMVKAPKAHELPKIAEALGVSLAELVSEKLNTTNIIQRDHGTNYINSPPKSEPAESLSPSAFLKLTEKERKDYLDYLKLTKQ